MKVISVDNFYQWRVSARRLLYDQISPSDVHWSYPEQESLFHNEVEVSLPPSQNSSCERHAISVHPKNPLSGPKVPEEFLHLALYASCHRDERKWSLLYRLLWRLTHGEKNLLRISSDDDTRKLKAMAKEVNRDRHKMKAFVRFRKTLDPNGEEVFVAWHQPSHLILPITLPFFIRRFTAMKFVILTPDQSACWDGDKVLWGEGETRDSAPQSDELETLWLTFYRNIFNPARIKVQAMKSEMPMKYWHTMPETELISAMLAEAPERVRKMIADSRAAD